MLYFRKTLDHGDYYRPYDSESDKGKMPYNNVVGSNSGRKNSKKKKMKKPYHSSGY